MRLIDADTLLEELKIYKDEFKGSFYQKIATAYIEDFEDMVNDENTLNDYLQRENEALKRENNELIRLYNEEKATCHKLQKEMENRWIPCSEQLPKQRTVIRESGTIETLSDVVLVTGHTRFFNMTTTGQMVDGVWNNKYNGEIIAWMPLPEPYKGG